MTELGSSKLLKEGDATILVVDDNPLIVGVLTKILSSVGYRVLEATNGQQALQVLESNAVDVIVCDVMMPKMDGYELQQSLRSSDKLCHIPFVFLSALGDSIEVIKGKECGADDYLTKPFDAQALLAIIRGKLDSSRKRKGAENQRYESYRKKVIHTLSHEFRTPLVAINTGAELLLEQQEALDKQKALNLLEAIRRGGERLERLVNDFMVLQQIEGGVAKRVFDSRAVLCDINRVVEQVLEVRADSYRQEQGIVTFEQLKQAVFVNIYEQQIHDVLDRLIMNGIKFSESDRSILVRIKLRKQEVGVEICDRGIGLDPNKINEALDPFGQIDRDRYEQQGGGMGLAIAARYALINNGRIEIRPRDGGGTIAVLILPIHKK